jgi:6-pyruvoyltetrahydropterin/6-carboxytetrahydropterin synthase
MRIFRAFTFDAAHRLPNVPATHRCSNLHGHTFRVEIHVDNELHPHYDWVIDFGDIKKLVVPVIEQLDHTYLNEIPGLENPTSENICKWLWQRIQPGLPILTRIVVQESPNSGAIYEGEGQI